MSALLSVSIAGVTACALFVGLGLISLLLVEYVSDTSQATIDDEGISDQDALAQLEGAVNFAPRDPIPTAHSAVADHIPRSAVIIRDPRLMHARTLSDHSGAAEETAARTSAEIEAISKTMEVLAAEIRNH